MPHMKPIILIGDENKLFVELIVKELSNLLPSYKIIGADTPSSLMQQIKILEPTLVIFCIDMMDNNDISIIKLINKNHKNLKTMTLGTKNNDLYNQISIYYNANSYISMDTGGIENFIDCVKIVLKTDLYVSNQVSNTKSSFDKNLIFSLIETMESLTKRELQVLTLSLKGYNNKEIAKKMFITPKSVENYINKISNKLNLNTKKESYRNWIYNNSEVIKLII